jgi:hypothetical protein
VRTKRGDIFLILILLGILSPGMRGFAQVMISTPKEGEISSYRNQAVIGQAPAGLPVRLDINGVAVDSGKVMPNGAFEFLGVPTPEGPVTYTVSVRFPSGLSFSSQRRMHILGAPDSIQVSLPSTDIPGDGRTVIPVTAHVLDRWRVKIPDGYFVTVKVDSLTIEGDDADPTAPGFQARLTGGRISFGLKSSQHPGPVVLELSTDAARQRIPLSIRTPRVPLMVVASADATGKYRNGHGSMEDLSASEDFRTGLKTNGRLAGIAKGTVFDDYLLTLSIDTDRKLQDQIYRDLDPKALYSMYGDNSVVTYEAQSTSPVYARLERDRSFLLYGDYNTLVTRNEFSAYNRSFTGGKLHAEQERYTLDLFGTVTNRKVIQEEIRGQGMSGYYYLQQNNVVTGSEKVRLEVRNRFHSEVVITRKDKARYSDYEIDYVQGSLYFKQPVPSLDEQNNPVYIVVSYEATTATASNVVAGGAGEVKPWKNLTIGATTVVEQRTPRNYTLLGGNACWQLEHIGMLQGEAARSADVTASGGAWKVEADISPYKLFTLRPYYRKVDGTFTNTTQSGSGRELGTTKFGGSFETEATAGTKIGSEFYHQQQSAGTLSTDVRSLSGSVQQAVGRQGDVAVKVEDLQYDGNNPEAPTQNLRTHSTLLTGTTRMTIVERLRATASYEHNLRAATTQVRPNAATIGLEYQATSAIAIWLQQKFLAEQGNLSTVGITTKVDDQTSVYGRYELGSSITGQRNAATIGLKNSWKVTDQLTTNILYEKTRNLSKNLAEAQTPDHDAVSLGLEYFPSFPLKATLKGEYNKDNTSTRQAVDAGVSYKLFNDLSVLGKGTYFVNDVAQISGHVRQSDMLFGIAYRPIHSNWINLIGKLEMKSQENDVVVPTMGYSATILALHTYLEPVHGGGIGIKYALKHSRDEIEGYPVSALTDFLLVRPQFDITSVWNVAGEVRALRQHSANDLKVGYSLETGFVVMKNVMIATGYNFEAYKERDLVEPVYSVAGPYVTLRLKLTEETVGLEGL